MIALTKHEFFYIAKGAGFSITSTIKFMYNEYSKDPDNWFNPHRLDLFTERSLKPIIKEAHIKKEKLMLIKQAMNL